MKNTYTLCDSKSRFYEDWTGKGEHIKRTGPGSGEENDG